MTEVPEHLLQRSAEARARLTGGDAPAPAAADTPAAAAPAAAAAAAAVPAVPEEPKAPEPVAPYVEAGLARKTVPVWIIPVLLFLPIWAIYYVGYLENPPAEAGGLLFEGEEVYSTLGCSGCHGGGGGGGTGHQLNDGEVLLTFPSFEANAGGFDGVAHHIAWVSQGTAGTETNGYGDPERPGGARETGGLGEMSGFAGTLSAEELIGVVYYERAEHGELDDAAAEAELHLLEAVVHVVEEAGASLDGASLSDIQHWVDEARAELAGESSEVAAG